MKKKFCFISIIVMLVMFFCVNNSLAEVDTLKIDITTSNPDAKVDDIIDVYVNWKQEMQAADYLINFDSDILEFVSTDDIPETNYNIIEPGKLRICWYGNDEKMTGMTFKFKVLNEGDAKVSVVADAFGTENLEKPENIETSPLIIENIVKKPVDINPTPSDNPNEDEPTNNPTDNPVNSPDENKPTDEKKPTQIEQIEKDDSEDKT